jgi:hypothetical protein
MWRLALLFLAPFLAWGQALPLADPAAVKRVYDRLLPRIEQIRIFDNHAHPGYADDPDVDAMASPPGSEAFRVRADNPELIVAARQLFNYPYPDLTPGHARWLIDKKKALKQSGVSYFNRVLDQLGIAESAANRVAMPDYLDAKRFRWVCFVDSFFFPFDNRSLTARNPDQGVFIPLQEKKFRRDMQAAGLSALPDTLEAYLAFVSRVLEDYQKRGAIAMKFEAAYFRSLFFSDPSRDDAAAIYSKYHAGGIPETAEYTRFQDFVFRHLMAEAGRLRMPVHIHTAVGVGDYFSLRGGNVFNLENVLQDPRYSNVTFVLVHGGYPFDREAIWLAARKNVYIDSSFVELLLYPSEFTHVLKQWLEIFPDKVVFGSDAFPYNEVLGAEESYWLAVKSARSALAAALAEMVALGEVNEEQALKMAQAYLHDTGRGLYNK